MRFIDLHPRWFSVSGSGGDKDGVTFLCPHCIRRDQWRCTICGSLWQHHMPGTIPGVDGGTFQHLPIGGPLKPCCDNTSIDVLEPDIVRIGVQFANPVGGWPKNLMANKSKHRHVHELRTFDVPPGFLWERKGEEFSVMSLHPSINAEAAGHWHGFIRNGMVEG